MSSTQFPALNPVLTAALKGKEEAECTPAAVQLGVRLWGGEGGLLMVSHVRRGLLGFWELTFWCGERSVSGACSWSPTFWRDEEGHQNTSPFVA